MVWFKADDQLWSHPKFSALSDSAQALWIRAATYAAGQLTDGFVSTAAVKGPLRGKPGAIRELTTTATRQDHALWEQVDGGYQFHDWAKYQPDSAPERERRDSIAQKRKEAGRKGAEARWHADRDGKPDGKRIGKPDAIALTNGWQLDSPVPVPVPVPLTDMTNDPGVSPEVTARAAKTNRPITAKSAREARELGLRNFRAVRDLLSGTVGRELSDAGTVLLVKAILERSSNGVRDIDAYITTAAQKSPDDVAWLCDRFDIASVEDWSAS